MPMLQGFIGGAYLARSSNFDAQRCVNLFPEKSDSGSSKDVAMLVGTPGLLSWAQLNGRAVRGMINFNDIYGFVVIGQYVYRVDTSGVGTLTGLINNDVTPVSMASNGSKIFVATGPKGFVIDANANTMTEYIDVSFKGANKVDFLDGSFIFNEPGTGRFWAMNPYSTTLNPLYFATAEGSPDALVSLIVDHRELWLFGTNTVEVWYNTGDTTNFPYSRVNGAFIEQGCAATHSVAKLDSSVFWLSSNERGQGMVMRATGYAPQRISTHALERAIGTYSVITDAVAYTYEQEGHSFYVLNFPTANKTWVFDASTNLWHERAWRQSDGQFGRHRSNCHMFFARKNIVGDWQTGNLYVLDPDTYTDNGNPLVRLRSSPHISSEMSRIAHTAVHFDMETGVGTANGTDQGTDPVCMLRWSDDGGHKWSNQRTAKIGRVGQYRTRARFTRLGQSRDRVYELSISDPVKVAIIGAILNGQ